jgi:hypothetical protein
VALTMWPKALNFRPWTTRHKYQHMQTDENDPAAIQTSFNEHQSRTGTPRLTEWSTVPTEEEHGNKVEDRESICSTVPSAESRFFPIRSPVPRRLGYFNRLKRMWTIFPIRDISWIVAFSFTMGSTVFVLHGFFLLLPLIDPETKFLKETPYATPASSFLGMLIFFVGGYAGFLEGMNLENDGEPIDGMAGEVIEIIEMTRMDIEEVPKEVEPKDVGPPSQGDEHTPLSPLRTSTSTTCTNEPNAVYRSPQPPLLGSPAFIYLPTIHQLFTNYARSLTFHAGLIQFLGTIIFSLATLTSLPGILPPSPTSTVLIPLLNLLPATLGALFFLASSILQLLSVQKNWYWPEIWKGEWHVGFWNAIGSLGFTLAGALPILGTEEASYVGVLADFWGSWAFLVGSMVQLFIVMEYYI